MIASKQYNTMKQQARNRIMRVTQWILVVVAVVRMDFCQNSPPFCHALLSSSNIRSVRNVDVNCPWQFPSSSQCSTSVVLSGIPKIRLPWGKNKKPNDDEMGESSNSISSSSPLESSSKDIVEDVSICVIGGGVSGLVAARTAAEQLSSTTTTMKIHLLESSSTLGGRVQSDRTEDGFCLDRGFAVFIPNYPMVQQCLDLEALQLRSFIPGSRVWVRGEKENQDGKWIKVSDPLRQPLELWNALMAPVGSSIVDKIKLLPLLWHVFSKSVPELFEEDETTTLEALRDRWGFSNEMIDAFFKPFLEGIYLAPLTDQSSRMFSFVFKMFSEGSATLPRGGIGAVAQQLADKARDAGVTIDTDTCVTMIHPLSKEDGSFLIETKKMTNNQEKSSDSKYYRAKSVIVATDVRVAESLLSNQECSEVTTEMWSEIPQRSVGCLYYSFDGEPPISEPILFLKGLSSPTDTPETHPINNVCFPSIVNPSYAPTGKSLCSVTILSNVLDHFDGDIPKLEVAVRRQLQGWFPSITSWSFLRHYVVRNAQPSQVGMYGANVNGGRDCRQFRGISLPPGLMVCGDHMATATLNGALESGVKAGTLAAAQEIVRDR